MFTMNKNDVINVDIIDIGNNGEGIAKYDNKVVFVPFALKNENIDVLVLKVNKNIAFAKIQKINIASPSRCENKCKYFTKCGGCNMQHIIYEDQLKIKQNIVANALYKYANITHFVQPCKPSNNIYYYRNKMQFPCTSHGIGMYAEKSHRVIDIDTCPLSKSLCNKAYSIFREFCNQTNQILYDESTHTGIIRNIVLREVDNRISICLVINGNTIPKLDILIDRLNKEFYSNFSLYLNINKQKTNTILSPITKCIIGNEELETQDFGITHFISPNSFMQINRDVQNQMYEQTLNLITPNSTIINAYSGAGLLSAILAKKAKFVYGIEIIEQATKNADNLMKMNNISNVKNITGDCSEQLPNIVNLLSKDTDTTFVLDPPRKGCDEKVLLTVCNVKPKSIIYISCNPATLARDLKILTNLYDIQLIQPYDMFPQTRHIETLVHLKLKENTNAF